MRHLFVVDSLDKHIQNEKKFILALERRVLILADAKKTEQNGKKQRKKRENKTTIALVARNQKRKFTLVAP